MEPGNGSRDHLSSPDKLALVWTGKNEVLVASPAKSGADSYKVDVVRLPVDFRLLSAIKERRSRLSGIPDVGPDTVFLTNAPEFSERTRVLNLADDVVSLPNEDLFEWLIDAEREMVRGTDQHPIFETPLSDTACSVVRLPNREVAMTEVPRQHVNGAAGRILQAIGADFSESNPLVVETPLRCVVRYYLSAVPDGTSAARKRGDREATAFLLLTKAGFSYGLWSSSAGLFSEYGFQAPIESSGKEGDEPGTPAEAYLRNAFDQLYLQLTREKLSQMNLEKFAKVVWVCDPDLANILTPIAADYERKAGVKFAKLEASADEATAAGLLFGSFGFGSSAVKGAEVLPPVNLAHDLLVIYEEEQAERRRIEEQIQKKRRASAASAMLLGPVIVTAIVLGLIVNLVRAQVVLGIRDTLADQKTVALKPDLERRKSYEANLAWYQGFVAQVSRLRRQQPVGIGLTYDLDGRYPTTIDPTFFISELKLAPNGEVEIKGLARSKDAVTSFLRSLEFAGGPTSGSKLFSNLTYEVQEGVPQTIDQRSTQARLPTIEGSAIAGTNLAPGVIGWSIKGVYSPMVEFAPKPTPSPGAAPAPAPSPAADQSGSPANASPTG